MKFLRNLLFVPIRLLMIVGLVVLCITIAVSWFLCVVIYDPLRWIFTGKYTCPDDRGEIIVEKANNLIDRAEKIFDFIEPKE